MAARCVQDDSANVVFALRSESSPVGRVFAWAFQRLCQLEKARTQPGTACYNISGMRILGNLDLVGVLVRMQSEIGVSAKIAVLASYSTKCL